MNINCESICGSIRGKARYRLIDASMYIHITCTYFMKQFCIALTKYQTDYDFFSFYSVITIQHSQASNHVCMSVDVGVLVCVHLFLASHGSAVQKGSARVCVFACIYLYSVCVYDWSTYLYVYIFFKSRSACLNTCITCFSFVFMC